MTAVTNVKNDLNGTDAGVISPVKANCSYCDATIEKVKSCGACKEVFYCDSSCQTSHWPKHKPVCAQLASGGALTDALAVCLEIGGMKVTCYKPMKAFEGARYFFYCQLLSKVHQDMKKLALQLFSDPLAAPIPIAISPRAFVERHYQSLLKVFTASDKEAVKSFEQKTGLTEEELISTIKESYHLLQQFAVDPETHATFIKGETEEAQQNSTLAFSQKAFNYYYRQAKMTNLGETRLSSPFMDPKKLSCVHYALANIEKNIDLARLKDSAEFFHFSWWFARGYKIVAKPREGDIVAYFFEKKQKLEHMGIFTKNKRVESKPGINHDFIYEHSWGAFVGHFGNRVTFLRRN